MCHLKRNTPSCSPLSLISLLSDLLCLTPLFPNPPPSVLTLCQRSNMLMLHDCDCTCLRAPYNINTTGREYIYKAAVRRTLLPLMFPGRCISMFLPIVVKLVSCSKFIIMIMYVEVG